MNREISSGLSKNYNASELESLLNMNRLSRLSFITAREAAVETPEKPVAEVVEPKEDTAMELVNQSVLFFFPSHVREQMEKVSDDEPIKFMGKDFTKKEILSLSNAVKGTILSFYLNLEMKREIDEVKGDESLLEAILGDDDEEDESEAWKYRN